ncbi:MAG: hypothetical protein U5L95_00075 [Candidatus Saccharibacteria bacterium]|nr:hypothetical protein [Candidatus Saccharibacteria bacterium]
MTSCSFADFYVKGDLFIPHIRSHAIILWEEVSVKDFSSPALAPTSSSSNPE